MCGSVGAGFGRGTKGFINWRVSFCGMQPILMQRHGIIMRNGIYQQKKKGEKARVRQNDRDWKREKRERWKKRARMSFHMSECVWLLRGKNTFFLLVRLVRSGSIGTVKVEASGALQEWNQSFHATTTMLRYFWGKKTFYTGNSIRTLWIAPFNRHTIIYPFIIVCVYQTFGLDWQIINAFTCHVVENCFGLGLFIIKKVCITMKVFIVTNRLKLN